MLRSIKTVLMGGLVAVTMGSCWELEQEVLSGITQEELEANVTPELIEVLKQSAYGAVVASGQGGFGSHGGYYSVQEVSSDQMAIPQKGADWEDGGIWLRTHRHTWISFDGPLNGAWQYGFRIVAESNLLLQQYPDLDDLVSELRVLRAFGYLLLIDNFGNVPIIRETDRGGSPPQNTRQEVFEFIEESILENVESLTRENTRTNLNYWTAHMMLAKLYLNAEVYTGTARWADAERILDVIINEGPYSLAPNFFSNFATNNNNSPENMFTVPYDANNAEGFNIHQMSFHYSNQLTFELQEQPWNGYAALEEFYNSYEDDDVRKASLREGPQFAADGVTPLVDDAFDGDPDGPEINFTPQINQLAPNAFRQAGTRVGKFEIAMGAGPDLNNDFPIYRYADVLLMKAEAAWRQGNNGVALQYVNMVRERANVPQLSSLDANVLLAERGRELFAEGHRRSDLIRFGRFNDAWWEKAASPSFRNLFPIPENQLQANPNLSQNPGY
ncbi:RagB/SusD family nutrient uptake outer membrane protein [Arthrospiribacter ruber]|uniref:RagB/SusD family nutrient uptake outer membrane protein n=1 Tax=Arthrospiribacter ruber TaxID=2487934 RepID=A0A951J4Z1_9BACT|nr:RagB/SusD family nutrient uptake outer membrane protein [Arthrospiribacter ruber]MBW3470048.1 RagB/SusD family nutrient uptake outer membrane protein [Arthrospiribacter ruber]